MKPTNCESDSSKGCTFDDDQLCNACEQLRVSLTNPIRLSTDELNKLKRVILDHFSSAFTICSAGYIASGLARVGCTAEFYRNPRPLHIDFQALAVKKAEALLHRPFYPGTLSTTPTQSCRAQSSSKSYKIGNWECETGYTYNW